SRETVESRCVLARENRGTFSTVYLAKVRITVYADSSTVIREGHGTGEGRGNSPGEVHDIALKAAETDATNSALATFRKAFGLELYRQSRTGAAAAALQPPIIPPTRFGLHPDDTTPIPRPSQYYGQHRKQSLVEQISKPLGAEVPSSAPPLASADPTSSKIDKSLLTLAEPKRRRDKSHLRFVA